MSGAARIAFIFARGGSRGVRDKNIRPVAGKPLIVHSIACALASQYLDAVVVSTDSDRIATVAREYGAEVLERPAELAADATPELLAWKHAIEACRERLGPDRPFVSLPATAPLRAPCDVDAAIERFHDGGCDILFGISDAHRNPYLNMVTVDDDDLLQIVIGGSNAVRRQDVPAVYDVTTCVYVGDPDYILGCEKLMQGRVAYVKIPVARALDIDTEFDLYLADLMLNKPFEETSQ